MRDAFPHFYKLSDDQIFAIWKDCIFVIDANVLLNLYRYQETSREDLLRVLSAVKNRLWMPYQAAMEFQRNRLAVIKDQKGRFDIVQKAIHQAYTGLEASFTKIEKRHAHIDLSAILNTIKKTIDDVVLEISDMQDIQHDVREPDELLGRIDSLLEGKVGGRPDQKYIDAIVSEGKFRYKFKQPPGFADEEGKKDLFYTDYGVQYIGIYGDLILWKQILDYAKEKNLQSIIFVTDDSKPDWWNISSGKTLGPRPELVSEIKAHSDVDAFHMYSVERFLKLAKEHLNIDVSTGSITEAREIARSDKDQEAALGLLNYAKIPNDTDESLGTSNSINSILKLRRRHGLSPDWLEMPDTLSVILSYSKENFQFTKNAVDALLWSYPQLSASFQPFSEQGAKLDLYGGKSDINSLIGHLRNAGITIFD
ncbi:MULTISPECIES: PIN-like domain-containing protein [unclassified Rhizobium]|uniref:PIN-like domain-containing protein n=1 Tax=unclassified Rhizobium TaxID=2613769 RepID=UPI001ADC43EF|nr:MULTISPECIES: PIN-like domain-containing protein [unclassified Rhizobium]MBO9100020.1 DUF4935 domain-containing protein [Rhizobium sp. L58/93]MBO9185913.1 DUF4935 domain-containing protein [Rhizobium sp. E27B/91]QXZ82849.1 DUF4935 domain-containing protein [Rhizobium sp. K1/93]QXZ89638.1 DUF4935 domain-containing protein [Rhizobium sp. K15/93]QYA02226.1 DUF4935 domain-containing protein [Rhizobium sp. B21/90]